MHPLVVRIIVSILGTLSISLILCSPCLYVLAVSVSVFVVNLHAGAGCNAGALFSASLQRAPLQAIRASGLARIQHNSPRKYVL